MQFFTAIVALAAVASAAVPSLPGLATMSAAKAAEQCGTGTTLHCCNKAASDKATTTEVTRPGLLSGILGNFLGKSNSLFDNCSPLEVGGIPGAQDILSAQCRSKVACCSHSQAVAAGGLVNLALPCVALGSIVG